MREPSDDPQGDPDQDAEDAGRAALREQNEAARRNSAIAHGRRIGGAPGGALAAAMLALRDFYEGPKRDDMVAISEHPGEPHDVDRDGMALGADEIGGDADVAAPAQPRRAPVTGRRRDRRRR